MVHCFFYEKRNLLIHRAMYDGHLCALCELLVVKEDKKKTENKKNGEEEECSPSALLLSVLEERPW